MSTDLLPSPAFLSSEAMVGRCTTPECQRLADLTDEDITFRVVANMSDGYYPVIGWLCPHCSVFQELFALPAAFQHTIEKIREATYSWHDRSGLVIPVTEDAFELVLARWVTTERYFLGDDTQWSREHPHPELLTRGPHWAA